MTNDEAKAYAALAMEKCGVPSITIGHVLDEMWYLFDTLTEQEAADRAELTISCARKALDQQRRFR